MTEYVTARPALLICAATDSVVPDHAIGEQPAHFRMLAPRLHHRIELVVDGAVVGVCLESPPGGYLQVERMSGVRRGAWIIFGAASRLYPGLWRTPYDPRAVIAVDAGVQVQ